MVSLPLVCFFSRMRNLLGLGNIKREDIPKRIVEGVANLLRTSDFLKVSDNGILVLVSPCFMIILFDIFALLIPKDKGSVEEQNSPSQKRCLNKFTEEPLRLHRLSTA